MSGSLAVLDAPAVSAAMTESAVSAAPLVTLTPVVRLAGTTAATAAALVLSLDAVASGTVPLRRNAMLTGS